MEKGLEAYIEILLFTLGVFLFLAYQKAQREYDVCFYIEPKWAALLIMLTSCVGLLCFLDLLPP